MSKKRGEWGKAVIKRDLAVEVNRCALEFPVLTITGPRQSGKTTLARSLFPGYQYFNLELPHVRAAFQADPVGTLSSCQQGAIFDEAQRVPDLFSYLQGVVDNNPVAGQFILTGSQNFALTEKISQSLAGRTAVLELLPLCLPELQRAGLENGSPDTRDLDEVMWRGSYPPIHDREIRPASWYASYLATYLERDLRQISAVQDLNLFQRFLALAAGRVGQLINTANLGSDVGVDNKTINRWLNLLQTGYIATRIQPFTGNYRKRLVRTPKLYFLDTGLACHLLGIRSPQQLATHPLRGAIFENWVFSEIMKMEHNRGHRPGLYFWRTHDGQEADFIRTHGPIIDLIECKSAQAVFPGMVKTINRISRQWEEASELEDRQTRRWLIYGGHDNQTLQGAQVCSWRNIGQLDLVD